MRWWYRRWEPLEPSPRGTVRDSSGPSIPSCTGAGPKNEQNSEIQASSRIHVAKARQRGSVWSIYVPHALSEESFNNGKRYSSRMVLRASPRICGHDKMDHGSLSLRPSPFYIFYTYAYIYTYIYTYRYIFFFSAPLFPIFVLVVFPSLSTNFSCAVRLDPKSCLPSTITLSRLFSHHLCYITISFFCFLSLSRMAIPQSERKELASLRSARRGRSRSLSRANKRKTCRVSFMLKSFRPNSFQLKSNNQTKK